MNQDKELSKSGNGVGGTPLNKQLNSQMENDDLVSPISVELGEEAKKTTGAAKDINCQPFSRKQLICDQEMDLFCNFLGPQFNALPAILHLLGQLGGATFS